MLTEGKRLRPLLLVLASQSVGGNRKNAIPLAIAFELVHASSLVHDDIIDKDVFRRGKLALCNNWSANLAILTGDLLIGYAVSLASSYGERIIRMISQSAIELCQGESLDLALEPSSTEEEYFQMIELKSAAFFQAAAGCGALVGGASSGDFESLANFGKNFGIAYQLNDDLLDLEPSEGRFSKDLKNGQVTLPLIHLYSISSLFERKAIDEAWRTVNKKNKENSDIAVNTILEKLQETNSRAYVENKITYYSQLATKSLAPLKNSPYKLSLLQMLKLLKRS